MAAATAVDFFTHNREGHLRRTDVRNRHFCARVDWVMSPSPGDTLVCCVKRTVPRQNIIFVPPQVEDPGTVKATHSIFTAVNPLPRRHPKCGQLKHHGGGFTAVPWKKLAVAADKAGKTRAARTGM
jgi:hypothetical protein